MNRIIQTVIYNQKFENWLLVTVIMKRADRVGGKNGNTVALLQNMECPDVDKKMSFQISDNIKA